MTVTIADALAVAVSSIRRVKEHAVTDRSSSNTNTASFVTAYRGSQQVALLTTSTNPDATLRLAEVAAVGFGADVLALASETFHTTLTTSPRTGQPWQPGELQEAVKHDYGRERGWVADALVVFVANRAGDTAFALLPYEVASRRLTWHSQPDAQFQVEGRVPDAIAQAMVTRPPLDAWMHRFGIEPPTGMTPTQQRAHMDCAVVKFIHATQPGTTVMLYCPLADTERSTVIEMSLNTRPLKPNGGEDA